MIKLLEDRIESLLNKLTPKQDPGQSVSYTSIDNSINIVNSTIDNFHVGTKRNDIIIGTDVAEIISGGIGRDKLTGGDGADGFLFGQEADFGKKKADLLKDFDPIEGDSILIEKNSFDLGKKVKFKSVTGKKNAMKESDSKKDFIYDDKKGNLYFNENGKKDGWGEGGSFAKLIGAPELGATDFTIV